MEQLKIDTITYFCVNLTTGSGRMTSKSLNIGLLNNVSYRWNKREIFVTVGINRFGSGIDFSPTESLRFSEVCIHL